MNPHKIIFFLLCFSAFNNTQSMDQKDKSAKKRNSAGIQLGHQWEKRADGSWEFQGQLGHPYYAPEPNDPYLLSNLKSPAANVIVTFSKR